VTPTKTRITPAKSNVQSRVDCWRREASTSNADDMSELSQYQPPSIGNSSIISQPHLRRTNTSLSHNKSLNVTDFGTAIFDYQDKEPRYKHCLNEISKVLDTLYENKN